MDFKHNFPIRAISVTVLFFFCWTFGGIFDIAYAIKNSDQQSAISNQQKENNQKSLQGSRPAKKKPEEKFQKTIEDIEKTLTDTTSDTDTKKNKLKTKRSEIEGLDTAIKKQFSDTERFLKGKGLPPEILDRHYKFVKHYEDNLKELKSNLDAIQKHSAKSKELSDAIDKTKKFLEKTKAPSKHKKLDPNKLPHRTAEPVWIEPRTSPEQFKEGKELRAKSIGQKQVLQNPTLAKGGEGGFSNNDPILVASAGSLNGLLNSSIPDTQSPAPILLALADPPSDADLAETIEVKFTPAIQAKAAELNHNPTKIYNWVRNNIEFVPTYGSIQGADMCLQTKQCNAIDTSSLLIALLRASGIHARYVQGTIELPIEKVKNWVGNFTDSNAALTLIASGRIPLKGLTSGGQIVSAQMEHVWVETYVPYDVYSGRWSKLNPPKTWIQLDPSFKQYNYTQGIDIQTAVPFDSQSFLNQIKSTATINEAEGYVANIDSNYIQTTLTNYQTQLQNYINQNVPNATVGDIMGKKEIIKQDLGILPVTLPYKKIVIGAKYSSIPDNLRHKVTFIIEDPYLFETSLSYTVSIPELAGERVTLSYAPATSIDQQIIDSYKGIYNTPAYLVKVKPQLKIEGKIVAEGDASGLGAEQNFSLGFYIPNRGSDIVPNNITTGSFYAIGIMANKLSPLFGKIIKQRAEALRNYLESGGDSASDQGLGEQMYLSALAYFYELDTFTNYSAKFMKVEYTKEPSEGIFGLSLSIKSIFGIPSLVRAIGVYIDVDRDVSIPVSLRGDSSAVKKFMVVSGNIGSNMENGIIEQMYGWGSISASKAIYVANNMGIKIYHVDQSNYSSVLPLLQVSNQVKTDIINSVNAGKEVTIPERNIQLNNWNGVGYIVMDPKTGSAGYLISGGLAGGSSTEEKDIWEIIGKGLLIAFTALAIAALLETFEALTVALVAALVTPWGWILIPFILLAMVAIAIIIYFLITEVVIPNYP